LRDDAWSHGGDDLGDLRLVDDDAVGVRRQLLVRHVDLVHAEDGDRVHGPDDHGVAGGELDRLLALDGAVGGRRQHGGVGVLGAAVPEVEPHLDAAEEEATDVRVLDEEQYVPKQCKHRSSLAIRTYIVDHRVLHIIMCA
jgi:hypothetical protein